MTQLGEWLKHIVIIVMLSTIADLLLPTKAMQRYVRAVFGLAIIAAMIQPVVPFFHSNWSDELAGAAAAQFDNAGQRSSGSVWNQTEQTYGGILAKQEEQDADKTLASSLKANLPSPIAMHVINLTVSDATTPNELKVTVLVDTSDGVVKSAITEDIGKTLNIPNSQVVVRTDGGL